MADEMNDRKAPKAELMRSTRLSLAVSLPIADYAKSSGWRSSFADPNALDDARLGKSFEETNSSARERRRRSLSAASAEPQAGAGFYLLCIAFCFCF